MFSFSHLIYGLIAAGLGFAGVKYTFQVVGYTGRQDWIEQYLGQGSTYFVFKIFSLALVIGGILYATGYGNSIMSFFFSPLRNIFRGLGNSGA